MIFLLGYWGYKVFDFFKIPGGAITGPLLVVAVFGCIYDPVWGDLSANLKLIFQMIIGTMIGCRFSRERVSQLKELLLPGLAISAWLLLTSLAAGIFIHRLTGFDLGTSLFSAVPGGIAEMGILALSYNLDVSVVSLFQFVRVLTVSLAIPIIAGRCNRSVRETAVAASNHNIVAKGENTPKHNYWTTLVVGGGGGLIAHLLQIPVGGMLGAMTTVGILRSLGKSLEKIPQWIIVFAQIGLGGYLGTSYAAENITVFRQLLLPIIFFSLLVVINGIIIGILANRFFDWDLTTALLACAAGGASHMGAIALDMDADVVIVGLIQVMRLVMVLLVMPWVIGYLIN